METIKNYLDNMFSNLPNTADVRKAKSELWQMMEDKYNELIEEGMSDNAAVGTVISEFGNLEELAGELNINTVIENAEQVERRDISLDEAEEFLKGAKKQALQIAIGVALCILSISATIIPSIFTAPEYNDKQVWVEGLGDGIGISCMFLLIAIGVVLFIYSSVLMKKWDFIDKEACSMDIATSEFVKGEETKFVPKYAMMLAIGVALCVISIIPAQVLSDLEDGYKGMLVLDELGGALMFVFVAVGVFFIVYSSNVKGSFEKLFKACARNKVMTSGNNPYVENDESGVEASQKGSGNVYTYSDDEKSYQYISPTAETVLDVFWPTITCIYLCWSFLTFHWYITWIIWPVAAVLKSVLESILKKRV